MHFQNPNTTRRRRRAHLLRAAQPASARDSRPGLAAQTGAGREVRDPTLEIISCDELLQRLLGALGATRPTTERAATIFTTIVTKPSRRGTASRVVVHSLEDEGTALEGVHRAEVDL